MLRILICLISLPLLACQEMNRLLTIVNPAADVQSKIIDYLKCKQNPQKIPELSTEIPVGVYSIINNYLKSEFLLDMKPKLVNAETPANVHCYFPDSKKIAQVIYGKKGTYIAIKDTSSDKILKTFVLDNSSGDRRARVYYHFEVSFLSVSPDGNYLTIAALCKQTDSWEESEGDVASDYGGGRIEHRTIEKSYPVIISCNIGQEKYIRIEHSLETLDLNVKTMPIDLYYLPNGYLCIKNQQGVFIVDISQWSATYSVFSSLFDQNSIDRINNKNITLKLHIPLFSGNIALSKDLKYLAYSGGNLNNISIDNQLVYLIKLDNSVVPLAISSQGKEIAVFNKENMKFCVYDIISGQLTHEFSHITDRTTLNGLISFSQDGKYLICQNKIFKADIKEIAPDGSSDSASDIKSEEDDGTCIIS
jgi:hypothetical protein